MKENIIKTDKIGVGRRKEKSLRYGWGKKKIGSICKYLFKSKSNLCEICRVCLMDSLMVSKYVRTPVQTRRTQCERVLMCDLYGIPPKHYHRQLSFTPFLSFPKRKDVMMTNDGQMLGLMTTAQFGKLYKEVIIDLMCEILRKTSLYARNYSFGCREYPNR